MMPTKTTAEGLKRVMGVSGLTLTIVNYTIGAGIFVLPAIVGIQMGAFGVFSYVFCAVMLGAIMLCYIEIGSQVTSSGGTYAYVSEAFGKFPGFVINWMLFFGWTMLSCAALLNIIADSLAVMYPVFFNPWARALLFFGLMSFMILLNVRNAKQSVVFLKSVTILKLLPLVGIIIFGLSYINPANLHWEHIPSISSFGNTALVLFFAFAGFESALNVSGEIINPKRTIPLGVLLGGVVLLVVYLLLQMVIQGVLGPQIANFKEAPLAAVAEIIAGPLGGTILLLTAAFSCFSTVSGDLLATPRLLFAGAHDGLFPKFLGKVHPTYTTPYLAVILYGTCIFLFSISGGFEQLATLASASILLIYLTVVLATIRMRMKKHGSKEEGFRMPGGLVIPFIAISAIVWLLTGLTKREVLSTAVFIGIVCVIYFVMRKVVSSKSEGVVASNIP